MKTFQNFIPYARPSINQEDLCMMNQVMLSSSLTRGPSVELFENAVANYCGATYAVSFNSGTTALQAAYFSVNGSKDDILITTPNTFAATIIGGIVYGSDIELIDIDRSSGNMSLENLGKNSTKRKIYIPVHFSGNPVDTKSLRLLGAEVIIEDAAHALGGLDNEGFPIGSCRYSDMAIFSFHPAKSITTGEGGMVTTNNPLLNERLRFFRNNGIVHNLNAAPYPGYYEVYEGTGNFNFTDFQAALGLSQLNRLPAFIEKRRSLVKEYRKFLRDEFVDGIDMFSDKYDDYSAHHLFVVQIDFSAFKKTRAKIMEKLKSENIGTQVHYIPLHHHPILKNNYSLPEMTSYYNTALTLPLFYDLETEDIKLICKTLKKSLME